MLKILQSHFHCRYLCTTFVKFQPYFLLKLTNNLDSGYKLMTRIYVTGLMNQNMILMILMVIINNLSYMLFKKVLFIQVLTDFGGFQLKTTRSMIIRKRYLKRNQRVTPPMMNQKKMRVPVKNLQNRRV